MSVQKAFAPARGRPIAMPLASWLAAATVLSFLLQIFIAFNRQINWDEFWFLTRIYRYRHGVLKAQLQTVYVHAFTWLPYVSDNVIDRIVTARVLMLGFEAGTFWLIYIAARRFVSREAALLGLFSYASLNYVLIHGAAFRADPVTTFFLMASVAIFLASELTFASAIAGALALAIAGLITIKSAFYLPVIGAILLWRYRQSPARRAYALKLGAGIAVSAVFFAAAYLLHRATFTHVQGTLASTASDTAETVFASGVFARTWPYMSQAILANPVTFAAILLGIRHCVGDALHAETRARGLVLLSFAFPFATLFFYRNSYPYYYSFALAPAAIVAGFAFERMPRLWERAGWAVVCSIFLALQLPGAIHANQTAQRATLAAVRKMFPHPVRYIDRCGMKSDYPRSRLFMSTWAMQGYHARGVPLLRDAIMGNAPPIFVIVNTPILQDAFAPGTQDIDPRYKLLPQDARALRENYVHHWGAIWVAGKDLGTVSSPRALQIAIAGAYTIESTAPVLIDHVRRAPSSVIALAHGSHEIESTAAQHVVLRYGDHLYRPSSPPPGDIFDGF
jgi:hypothetical protein